MSAPTYLFGLCACEAGVLPRYVHAHFISPRSPRSLLVHVTHQSAVCSPLLRQCGGRAEECSLCAILGHTGCSSSVTTAVHGCVFASFFYVYGLWMQACVYFSVCVCVAPLCRCTHLSIAHFRTTTSCLQLQMNGSTLRERESQSIVQGICL